MKVIFLFRSLAIMGGVEKVIIEKMNVFAEHLNYNVTIITYEQGNHKIPFTLSPKVNYIDLNCVFYKLYQNNILKRTFKFLYLKSKFRKKINRIINDVKPDILMCTTYSLLDVSTVIKNKTVPIKIIESHSEKDAILKRKDNNLLYSTYALFSNYLLIEKIKKSSIFITLTHEDFSKWSEIQNKIVIPNMLYSIPNKVKTESSFKKVLSLGRLEEQKGYDMLIKAWIPISKKHPDWRLEIFGSGSKKDYLNNLIDELDLNKYIKIKDPINNVYNELQNSDLYVLSSRWEGFGMVLIEAMISGVPPVSFACPCGPKDIIKDGEDGLLVENGNIEQLTEKICYLIENEDVRKEMGKKARINVERFKVENIAKQWDDLFKDLLSQKEKH